MDVIDGAEELPMSPYADVSAQPEQERRIGYLPRYNYWRTETHKSSNDEKFPEYVADQIDVERIHCTSICNKLTSSSSQRQTWYHKKKICPDLRQSEILGNGMYSLTRDLAAFVSSGKDRR